MKTPVLLSLSALLSALSASPAFAASVTMTASDAFGASSFNSGGKWSNGAAPSAGNTYSTTYSLRTPATTASYSFAGDSLSINSAGSLVFKGTGTTAVITIGNLILNGGQISHAQTANPFNLAGGLNVASAGGTLNAQNGNINIQSLLTGAGPLTITSASSYQAIISNANNSFTGNISVQNTGKLTLTSTGNLKFLIGASGVNNSIAGTAAQVATFDGKFTFDLTGASTAAGSNWTIIDVSTLAETFGATFSIAGFTDNGDGTWTSTSGVYKFTKSTGILSVVSAQVYPQVTMTANDAFGASSFNTAGKWSNGQAPSSGNDYFTGARMLRTPANSSPATFAGHALSVDNGGSFAFKGTSSAAIMTVPQMMLNGGSLVNLSGSFTLNLAGNLNIPASGGILNAQDGGISIQSAVSGAGPLVVTSGSATTPYPITFSNGNNSFTGDISIQGQATLLLSSAGKFNFMIGANGVNNDISGINGTQNATFNGAFSFDLTGAAAIGGSSWTIVDLNTLAGAFGSSFSVSGFTQNNDVWTSGRYQFSEATGKLTVVCTWNGAAGDGNFATAGNWEGSAIPANNDTQDTAVFNGGTSRIIAVPASRSVKEIHFNTVGWTLNTGSFSNLRTISSTGIGTNTMGLPVSLSSSGSFTWMVTTGNTLALTGAFTQRNSNLNLTGGGILQIDAAIAGDTGTVGSWGIHVVNGLLDIHDATPYQSSSAGAVFINGSNAALKLQTTVANAQALITAGRIVDQLGNGLNVEDLGGGVVQVSSATQAPVPPIPGNWTLTYSEEFDGFSPYLNGNKWRVGSHWAGMPGSAGNDPACISVGDGKLKLKSQMRSYSFSGVNYSYAAGEISTFKTFRQQYGYFECRAKYPGVTGLWPAFWLMPDRGTYGWADGYRQSYLKFDLTGANITEVTSAELKVTTSSAATDANNNLLIMKLRDDSWTESTLKWNNKPTADPAWIKQFFNQTYAANQQLTTDVTGFVAEQISGDKKVSFVLADTFECTRLLQFHSREASTQAYHPQLVINGVTYYASEDSHVRWGTLANTNYGASTVLQVTDSYQDASSTYSGGMETDILESLGIWGTETTQHTLHWDGYTTSHQSATSGELSYAPTADGYHTYGLYWAPGVMEFYIDGVQSWSWADARVCSVPCYMLLSLQLGGWGNNNPGPQVDNQAMQVDWVRVWSGTKN